ncbi:hypothetical protein MB46_18675 [Arthrobacter alpinus]|uniref:AbiTii domain-containing protein n=1 Tax=Arthrobacter alpinus TaxID=656366 RepID=UPI0005CAD830|nr:hypothetical protein [Arthrobacter alpinus]ALV47217.1 hypothetical protein MB46_18675 [Arthrobacter alpinus]
MSSQLEQIINDSADETISLESLLFRVKIVAMRLRADNLVSWANGELNGFEIGDGLPAYRQREEYPVLGNWSGPMNRMIRNQPVSPIGLKETERLAMFTTMLRQPVSELEALAAGNDDPGAPWDASKISHYEYCVQNKLGGAGFEFMSLFSARMVFPRTMLKGKLTQIRSAVVDLALKLEQANPSSGEPGGPTIGDEEVQAVVQNFTINNYGDGNNIAAGSEIKQRAKVVKNDMASLVVAAKKLGLSDDAAEEFREAVLADGEPGGTRTQKILERVRSGTLALAGGITTDLAVSGLLEAANGYFGAA